MAKYISTLYQEEIKKENEQHKKNRFKFFCCASNDKKLHIMFEEIHEILDQPRKEQQKNVFAE
jgi:primosomal protein N''